jgi:hypothetical protein
MPMMTMGFFIEPLSPGLATGERRHAPAPDNRDTYPVAPVTGTATCRLAQDFSTISKNSSNK